MKTLCEPANSYAWYVTSMNGQQGVQPNGNDLETALDQAEASATEISTLTQGRISEDSKRIASYWHHYSSVWNDYGYDAAKVTTADLPKFKIPGYQRPGKHVLDWTVATCGGGSTPFPRQP